MADLRTVLRIIAKDETKGALTKTKQELKGIGTTLGDLRNQAIALAGINFGIGGLAQLTALADGYALTTSRLKLLSGETENFAAVQKEVFEIAQSTFTTYEQTAAIYGNLAASTQEIGATSEDLLKVTKALNQSYLISGSTQQEAKASTLQLTQALASGQIRGQEFNSIAEQGRRILFGLKDATGKTAGELRQFANEGKLTTDFFFKNFLPQAEKINEEFDTLPLTVGRSLTQLQNEFERFVGEQNKELGITRDIALAFQALADNFEDFATAVVVSGGAVVAFLTNQFAVSLAKTTVQKLDDAKATVATIKADQAKSISLRQVATDEFRAAAATEARIATQLASERATLESAKTLGVVGGQRVALERTINQLNLKHVAAVNARVAADAKLIVTNNAVAASAVRTTIAMRALNASVLFLGGPVGIAVTAILALGTAIAYYDTQTKTGAEAAEEFNDRLGKIKESSDETGDSLSALGQSLLESRLAEEVATLAAGDDALKKLGNELNVLQDRFRRTGESQKSLLGIALQKKIEEYDELSDKVEKYRIQFLKQVRKKKTQFKNSTLYLPGMQPESLNYSKMSSSSKRLRTSN